MNHCKARKAAMPGQHGSNCSKQAGLAQSLCFVPCWSMVRLTESRFYRVLRRAAAASDLVTDRLENAVGEGWPDVLIRGDNDIHIWVELKIAKGSKAKIRVRPEQINWLEDHSKRRGRCGILAWNQNDKGQFWFIEPHRVRHCAEHGCLGEPCYAIRHLPMLVMRWMGIYVDIQRQNPTPFERRPRMAASAKSRADTGTSVQIVRRSRLRNRGNDRGSHHSESPWGDS